MKKQILLALPLATGLFAVSGAANAADAKCRIESGTTSIDSSCNRIVVEDKNSAAFDIELTENTDVTIDGEGNTFNGRIIVDGAKSVTINDLTIDGYSNSSAANIWIKRPTTLTVNDSKLLGAGRDASILDSDNLSKIDNAGTFGVYVEEVADNSTITLNGTEIIRGTGISNRGADRINLNVNNSTIKGYAAIDFSLDRGDAGNKISISNNSRIIGVNGSLGGGRAALLLSGQSGAEVRINGSRLYSEYINNTGHNDGDIIRVEGDVDWNAPVTIVAQDSYFRVNDGKDSKDGYIFSADDTDDAKFVAIHSALEGALFEHQVPVTYHYGPNDNNATLIAVDKYDLIDDYYRSQEPVAPEGYVYDWYEGTGRDKLFDFDTEIKEDTDLYATERQVANTTPGDTPSDTPSDNQGGIGSENQGSGSGNDNVDNPNTADSITLYMTVATIALLGLGATALIAKKSRR